jgi:serine/threonine protein kinase
MAELVRQYLGNYRLGYLLGHGGFADVYLGEHITLKSRAAIKVLRMQLVPEAQGSFLHEALTIAGLDHPNIVNVLEFGVDHHTPYLVMSYAPNGTLRQRYARGTILPSADILPYVRQISAALQYAHDRQLVHRDIKPENLLLGADDHVLLSDFGLAIMTQSVGHSGFQAAAGTTAYMAPEQLYGKACMASDQYALGIIIYEWLTGSWPFNGSDQGIALQHVQCSPPLLSEKVPAISPAIETVIMKALAKNPSERFLSIKDFASAFEEACFVEIDAGLISTRPQMLPVVINGPDSWQVDTPDSLLFLPDSISSPVYVYDEPVIITDPSLVSALSPTSDAPMPSASSAVTSLSIEEPPSAAPELPLPFPANALPITPLPQVAQPKRNQKRVARRSVLVGLAGVAVASITGIGISSLVSAPKRQTTSRSTQQEIDRATSPASTPDSAGSQAPTVRGTTSTMSPGSAQNPEPTIPPSPTDKPGSKNKQPLTVQITNPPMRVQNNSQVNVDVSTNEPGVTVTLRVSYNAPSPQDVILQKITDSSGQAIFSWQVQVPNTLSSNTIATLTVSALDQYGRQAEAASLTVTVSR